jgi:hypothetical protein
MKYLKLAAYVERGDVPRFPALRTVVQCHEVANAVIDGVHVPTELGEVDLQRNVIEGVLLRILGYGHVPAPLVYNHIYITYLPIMLS